MCGSGRGFKMQEYINYLKNVLGVSQVVIPASTSADTSAAYSRISVWIENYNQFTTEDHTLLNNMLAAMKIPEGDMIVRDLSLKTAAVSPIEFDLVVSPDASAGNQTYSPQVLHANKNLKSTVWTFLQTIMQKYKSLT